MKNDGLSLGVAKSKDDILYNSGISLDNGVSLGHTVMKNDGLSLGVAKSKNDILSSENISKDNKVSKVRKDLKK
jgi:hypothetical protein